MYQPDEEEEFEITNERWLMFFNEGGNEIRPHTQLYVTATTHLLKGVRCYGIPSDLDVLHEVYRRGSVDSDIYNEMSRVKEETLKSPWEYSLWNGQIKIAEPTEDLLGGLKMYYWKKLPKFVSVTDNIELEDPYILGYYALSRVELADRNLNEFAIHNAEYTKRLNGLKSKIPEFDLYELESRW